MDAVGAPSKSIAKICELTVCVRVKTSAKKTAGPHCRRENRILRLQPIDLAKQISPRDRLQLCPRDAKGDWIDVDGSGAPTH